MKTALFLFFAVLFSSSLFAADADALKKATTLNESAVVKMKARNLDGAEADLLQALVYAKEHPKIRKNLSVVYY